MVPSPIARALFHLVPLNAVASEALQHPDNQRFVSPSADGDPGLEVGFHVSTVPGRVIARLGRNADLILPRRNVSAVHVAFEMHPDTLVVLLSVRAKRMSSVVVRFTPAAQNDEETAVEETLEGDCVLNYGQGYEIDVAGCKFSVAWRQTKPEALRAFAVEEYKGALRQQANVRSRHLPTEGDSEAHTWHNTRIHSARRVLFREADGVPRVKIGQGQFGAVYRAVDLESGHAFAVKVIDLTAYPDAEQARAVAHREVKALQRLDHKNIIEFLGHDKWESNAPEIFMPFRDGNLRALAKSPSRRWADDQLCTVVLEQMLSALDHLAYHDLCHRDVKPENILYWEDKGGYTFQLADFGLSNHRLLAVTKCGTGYYEAPELYPEYGRFAQSPKMDVWSLFATIADIHNKFNFPPTWARSYADVLQAVRVAAIQAPELAEMVRENPEQRASAAQLLVAHFNGRGLSTPRGQVPPLPAVRTATAPSAPMPAPQPPPRAPGKAPMPPPLVKYAREPRRRLRQDVGQVPPPPLRPLGGRITKPSPSAAPARRLAIAPVLVTKERAPDKTPAKQRPKDEKEKVPPESEPIPMPLPVPMPGSFPV